MKTLLIDNFDSFTHLLFQYCGELGGNPVVYRNNEIRAAEIRKMNPTHIIISPGPGHPAVQKYFGVCAEVLQQLSAEIPTLGVCLGHQGIVTAFGGKLKNAAHILHGKTSLISHHGKGILAGVANPFPAMRYHSLLADPEDFPAALEITAHTAAGEIMAVQHREFPLYGIQFHPESIGTPEGKKLLYNFLQLKKSPGIPGD